MACFETDHARLDDGYDFIHPMALFWTQATECPSNIHVRPYDHTRDPGITIGVDEHGRTWIIGGHNRVGAAILQGVLVKISEIRSVNAHDMHALADG